MKKFICILVCLLMIMSCAYGCARPSIETAPETTVSESETSAPTEIEATVSREDEVAELEETFIESFGEDNVSFWWSDEGDAYFITIWCDFTFDEFYEFDVNSKTRETLTLFLHFIVKQRASFMLLIMAQILQEKLLFLREQTTDELVASYSLRSWRSRSGNANSLFDLGHLWLDYKRR